MKLNTKGRFAVVAMIDIAMFQSYGRVNISSISKRQNISEHYLENLLGKLKNKGLLNSLRGPGGGYFLNRSDIDIVIADIILAIEENIDITNCKNKGHCNIGNNGKSGICITHNIWLSLNDMVWNYLRSISLRDVINNQINIYPTKKLMNI